MVPAQRALKADLDSSSCVIYFAHYVNVASSAITSYYIIHPLSPTPLESISPFTSYHTMSALNFARQAFGREKPRVRIFSTSDRVQG